MESISNTIKIMFGLFLSLALIALMLVMLNMTQDATKQAQQNTHETLSATASSSSGISDINAAKDTVKSTLESENKKDNAKTSGMSSLQKLVLILIIPALVAVFLIGRHMLSYARNSDDSQISAPWTRSEEGSSNNRVQRTQRPATVADAIENMLANSNNDATDEIQSQEKHSNPPSNDDSNTGIRVIREVTEDSDQREREEDNDSEMKRVIR